jgi:hypothetical protein
MINFYGVKYVLEERDSGWVKTINLVTPVNDEEAILIAKSVDNNSARRILYKVIYDSNGELDGRAKQ